MSTENKADDDAPVNRSVDSANQRAMDRLRDRTDELELIISSLTIFALFSVPGWFWRSFANVFTHLSTSLAIVSQLVSMLLTGLCYGLAACFVLHLMVRAYWVGLIGLRSAFPDGIRWDRTPTIGPLTRAEYQRALPDLARMIEGTDRLASSLFAVISMLTLVVVWFAIITVVTVVVGSGLGSQFGATRQGLQVASILLLVLFFGVPFALHLIDAQIVARSKTLQRNRPIRAIVASLRGLLGLAYPKRLLLPVQLTLQSNTRPFTFIVVVVVVVLLLFTVGQWRTAALYSFTVSNEFKYLDNTDIRSGFRTVYYEDSPSATDKLRAWPRITSFVQRGSVMSLFLPYQPLRDNLVLEQTCGPPDEVADAATCLSQLWSVRLDGNEISLQDFVVAQRSDIAMRGLMGIVVLDGLSPGLHRLEVTWGAGLTLVASDLDDRYEEDVFVWDIPFAFSPEFERSLP